MKLATLGQGGDRDVRPVPDSIFCFWTLVFSHDGHFCTRNMGLRRILLVASALGVMEGRAPAPASAVLAPYEVTRDACDVTQLSSSQWLLCQGSSVASFFGANGPAHIVLYNWNKLRGSSIDSVLVGSDSGQRRPVEV